MNYHYSADQVADCSELNCSDGSMSAMSSGTNIASKSLPSESQRDTLKPPRSLLTCVSSFSPVQPENIGALRTWLAAVSPASHSQLPGSEKPIQTSGTCGPQRWMLSKQSGHPFATLKTSPDYSAQQWVTPQADLFSTLERYCAIWPKAGILLNGECWELLTSGQNINANGYGLWRTPKTPSGGTVSAEGLEAMANGERRKSGHTMQIDLRDQVRHPGLYPTPRSVEVIEHPMKVAIRLGDRTGNKPNNLQSMAKFGLFPTPTTNSPAHKSMKLSPAGRRFSTDGTTDLSLGLADFVNVEADAMPLDSMALNPDWVEQLMGWPIGWSSIEPIENLEFDADWSQWEREDIPRVIAKEPDMAKRLRAIGNGQVPLTVATAYRMLEAYK